MIDKPERKLELTCFCRAFCCAHKIFFLTTLTAAIVFYHTVARFENWGRPTTQKLSTQTLIRIKL